MVRVYNNDLERALNAFTQQSAPIINDYRRQSYFHPESKKNSKKAMKRKVKERPGGRQSRYRGNANVKRTP